jgi:hypothetical protein
MGELVMAKVLDQRELIELLTRSVRAEIVRDLGPIISKIADAANEMQAALSGGAPRRGRKPGAGRPGRKPGKAAAKAVAAAAPAKPGKRRAGGNAPRGALKAAVMEILRKSSKPVALSAIVAAVMKTSDFKGRNEKSIYNKVNADLNKAPEVARVGKGVYALKSK